MIINILFYYSFVIFKRFNNALIVVHWVLLVSPNLLNHGDDLISQLPNFKNGVQVSGTTTYHSRSPVSGVYRGGVAILRYLGC